MLSRAFLAASLAWAAAIPLAAFAASRSHASSAWYGFALGVYAIGSMVCHQLPLRSFHLAMTPWPVCARCTGIYFGAAAAALVGVVKVQGSRFKVQGSRSRAVLIVAALPTAITLIYEWTTGVAPGNWIRAVAGVPLGAVVAWMVGEP